jgi:NAD(P)H-nitrite reductase large subunit
MASGRVIERLLDARPDAWGVTLFNAEPRGKSDRIMLSDQAAVAAKTLAGEVAAF